MRLLGTGQGRPAPHRYLLAGDTLHRAGRQPKQIGIVRHESLTTAASALGVLLLSATALETRPRRATCAIWGICRWWPDAPLTLKPSLRPRLLARTGSTHSRLGFTVAPFHWPTGVRWCWTGPNGFVRKRSDAASGQWRGRLTGAIWWTA